MKKPSSKVIFFDWKGNWGFTKNRNGTYTLVFGDKTMVATMETYPTLKELKCSLFKNRIWLQDFQRRGSVKRRKYEVPYWRKL